MIKDFLKNHKYVFIAIFIVWLIFFSSVIWIASNLSFSETPNLSLQSFGVFGDSFNVLTSLFTGLAFAGVIISVILQTQELKEARDEFRGQKEALENQEFDNKFFQMLNLLNNITERLTLDREGVIFKGKDIFLPLKDDFHQKIYNSYEQDVNSHTLKEDKFSYFKDEFDDFNNTFDTTFKYYFINLYQILKYIDTYSGSKDTAKEYTNMLRAQLTKNELILLAYNAIGVQNFTTKQYQQLVERYSFFEHLRYADFCENENIIQIITSILVKYDNSAFGQNDALIQELRLT
ncbi:MAG: hypothetical protein NTY39_02805 [Campylobacterales bacterium]|nr:hypothetical protein [Campylobacterales bacterium]